MKNELPQIQFESSFFQVEGIEIITLEGLMQRRESLNHFPEKPHQLEFYALAYYTAGRTKHLVDFVWHEVKANTLLYLSKGQVNAFNFKADIKGYLILFTEDYFIKQLNRLPNTEVVRLFNSHLFSPKLQIPDNSKVQNYIELLFAEFYDEKESYNKANTIDALFTVLFSKLEQLKKFQTFHIKESEKLSQFLQFKSLVEQHFTQSRNADFYADKMHMSYKHLNSICKEIIDSTAKQFIDAFIILESKRRLINSSVKSTELAFNMGFEEPTNFVKYFKKKTGLTPNMFKNTHK
ncbi:helix-turn-helix domain-containing protein [Maribacter algarum]|uniref:Helix-turn-helix domain-containing protein n=1 Tax=Maribacter algarum (ex Zhang et al. 2020) TaxID=2578118 RepID=A0A5S3PSF7_9FLAO|nr:helix-turn-helix domain-containing protein [Maribacter algarum]TMM56833.1 helix-turn-helix domain-containing protein [Maribacter algarum]